MDKRILWAVLGSVFEGEGLVEVDPTLRIAYVERGTVPAVGAVWCFTHAVLRVMADEVVMEAMLTPGRFTCVECAKPHGS